jgi:AraC family transcriptional regulator
MNAVGKAIWFIETHFSGDVSLDEIAKSVGVSRYYLVRAFGVATGCSVMRYVRGRRLTEAARSLINGAPDILTVALDAGYSSHEAFTRAFREQFGLTPETVRAQRRLCNIELVEPIKLNETLIPDLKPARFDNGGPLLIAGLGERYHMGHQQGCPGAMAARRAALRRYPAPSRRGHLRRCLQRRRGGQFRLHRRRGSDRFF